MMKYPKNCSLRMQDGGVMTRWAENTAQPHLRMRDGGSSFGDGAALPFSLGRMADTDQNRQAAAGVFDRTAELSPTASAPTTSLSTPNVSAAPDPGRRDRMMGAANFAQSMAYKPMMAMPTLAMADGGVFDGVKRMIGMAPPETMTQKFARQDAERAAKTAPAAPPPQAPAEQAGIAGYVSNSALQRRSAAAGLRDGGDLRTGHGGHVPGSGSGDKISAKYEPGEFVVSNDMLDQAPGLREQLHGLRGQVLAAKGMTPEEADAKAVSGGGGLRANAGFYADPRFAQAGANAANNAAFQGLLSSSVSGAEAAHSERVNPKVAAVPPSASNYVSPGAAVQNAPASMGQQLRGAATNASDYIRGKSSMGPNQPTSNLATAKSIASQGLNVLGKAAGVYNVGSSIADNGDALGQLYASDAPMLNKIAGTGEGLGNVAATTALNFSNKIPLIGPVVSGLVGANPASRIADMTPSGSTLRQYGGLKTGGVLNTLDEPSKASAATPAAKTSATTPSAYNTPGADATMPGQDPGRGPLLRGQSGINMGSGAPGVSKFVQNGKTLYSNITTPGDNDALMNGRAGVSTVPGMSREEIDRTLGGRSADQTFADNAIRAANLRDGVDMERGTAAEVAGRGAKDALRLASSPLGTPGRAFAQKQLLAEAEQATLRRSQDITERGNIMQSETSLRNNKATNKLALQTAEREQESKNRDYNLNVEKFGVEKANTMFAQKEKGEKDLTESILQAHTSTIDGKSVIDQKAANQTRQAFDTMIGKQIQDLQRSGSPEDLARAKNLADNKINAIDPATRQKVIAAVKLMNKVGADGSNLNPFKPDHMGTSDPRDFMDLQKNKNGEYVTKTGKVIPTRYFDKQDADRVMGVPTNEFDILKGQ